MPAKDRPCLQAFLKIAISGRCVTSLLVSEAVTGEMRFEQGHDLGGWRRKEKVFQVWPILTELNLCSEIRES